MKSKGLKVEPAAGIVYLKIEALDVPGMDTSSLNVAVEYAEVIAAGEGADYKKGDKVFVKAWAIDTINHENKVYRFCHVGTNGILAKVK